jgi:hypothetical protein
MREAVLSGDVWIQADRRGSAACIACSGSPCALFGCCEGVCWPTLETAFEKVYQLNEDHLESSGLVWQGCGGDRVKGKLNRDLYIDPSTFAVYGELIGYLWRDRQCHEDGERRGPVAQAFSVPVDTTLAIPGVEIHYNENTVLFHNLALENRRMVGSLPIPPFADHSDVARTRRRVHVTGQLEVKDDDIVTPDITDVLDIDTNIDLDPWNRKLTRSFSICVGKKIVGEVKLTAELHGDLETIDVAATLLTKHGKALQACNNPVTCGQDYVATGPVGPGQSAAIPLAEDDCREDPGALTQYNSFARFKNGVVENLTWTPSP